MIFTQSPVTRTVNLIENISTVSESHTFLKSEALKAEDGLWKLHENMWYDY